MKSVTVHTLKARSASKKAKIEAMGIIEAEVKFISKMHVAGFGYVTYFKNADKVNVAHMYREFGEMKLSVK